MEDHPLHFSNPLATMFSSLSVCSQWTGSRFLSNRKLLQHTPLWYLMWFLRSPWSPNSSISVKSVGWSKDAGNFVPLTYGPCKSRFHVDLMWIQPHTYYYSMCKINWNISQSKQPIFFSFEKKHEPPSIAMSPDGAWRFSGITTDLQTTHFPGENSCLEDRHYILLRLLSTSNSALDRFPKSPGISYSQAGKPTTSDIISFNISTDAFCREQVTPKSH